VAVAGLVFALGIVPARQQPVLFVGLQEPRGFLPVLFRQFVFAPQTNWDLPTIDLVEQSTVQTLQCLV
jgi:hypothetical protein